VVVDEALAGCGGDGCFIAGIDTHVPRARRCTPAATGGAPTGWSLYDAYYRGAAEAGVLLSGAGCG
jgi:hypothetical protein